MECDDCGTQITIGVQPDGRDGPLVCRDCHDDQNDPDDQEPARADQQGTSPVPEAVRRGDRYPDGEPRPMSEYHAHEYDRAFARLMGYGGGRPDI